MLTVQTNKRVPSLQLRDPFTCKSSLISTLNVNACAQLWIANLHHLYQARRSASVRPQWKIKATCHHLRLVLADQPELKQIDQVLVKQTHAAATTFILEAVKQSADSSSIR